MSRVADDRKGAHQAMWTLALIGVLAFSALYAWWPVKDWEAYVLSQVLPAPQVSLPYRSSAVMDTPLTLGTVVVNPVVDQVQDKRLLDLETISGEQLYLVQHSCALDVDVVDYLSAEMVLISADDQLLQRLVSSGCVTWMDFYYPEYKLAPATYELWNEPDRSADMVELELVLNPAVDVDMVIDTVYGLDDSASILQVTDVPGSQVLLVEIRASRLPMLAELESVLWIGTVDNGTSDEAVVVESAE